MTTHVPSPTLTDIGFVAPTEQEVLTGRKEDFNDAFGVDLNFGNAINPTPQGQLAVSDTAIIGAANDAFISLANNVDPAFAAGRMQDAIARIYFLQRLPGQSTVVTCLCIGAQDTPIPAGSLARARDGRLYEAINGGVIPLGGSISLEFACTEIGPVACPADSVIEIYRTIPGWDTINNPADGVLGSFVETRQAFEARRAASVAHNSVGFLDSVLGAVLSVDGVLDAYVTDNPNSFPVAYTPAAVIVGSIAGTTLTVDEVTSGVIEVGQTITGSANGLEVAAGTVIVSGSGSTWTIDPTQTVAQTTMNLGGVILQKNDLYVAAVGGDQTAVATAIWSKKSPGCPYYLGNTTVTVYDSNVQYPPPGIPYQVKYETPASLPFVVQVTIANSTFVPANAVEQIRAAVIATFAGTENGRRITIGSAVYANRFYNNINALGYWAEIVSLFLGTQNNPSARFTGAIGASFTGTATGTTLTITSVTGYISVGDIVNGTGVPAGTTIESQDSGTAGGAGDYTTSVSTTATAAALTTDSEVINVTAIASGAMAVQQFLFDDASNIDEGTRILSQISGSAGAAGRYEINRAQRVASEAVYAVTPNRTVVQVLIDQVPTISADTIQVLFA